MTEQPRFDDSSELVPHRNFTIPFNYVWERESERWIPMEEGFGGSYLELSILTTHLLWLGITTSASKVQPIPLVIIKISPVDLRNTFTI